MVAHIRACRVEGWGASIAVPIDAVEPTEAVRHRSLRIWRCWGVIECDDQVDVVL